MALQSMTALASITLQEASASVSLSGIPQNYRDLVLSVTGSVTIAGNVILRLNGDSGSNYSFVYMFGSGTSAVSGSGAVAGIYGGGFNSSVSSSVFNLIDYSATNKHKTVLNRTDTANDATYAWANRWANTVAVNSINVLPVSGNLVAGTIINLYGRIA